MPTAVKPKEQTNKTKPGKKAIKPAGNKSTGSGQTKKKTQPIIAKKSLPLKPVNRNNRVAIPPNIKPTPLGGGGSIAMLPNGQYLYKKGPKDTEGMILPGDFNVKKNGINSPILDGKKTGKTGKTGEKVNKSKPKIKKVGDNYYLKAPGGEIISRIKDDNQGTAGYLIQGHRINNNCETGTRSFDTNNNETNWFRSDDEKSPVKAI